MKWEKKGLIFKPERIHDWMISHASVPIADKLNDEVLRIYFGTRDNQNRSYTSFIEVNADNPQEVLYVHDKPVLSPGKLGCFDDSGAMPSSIVNYNNKKYLYYIGWNLGVTVSYRNSIGLAVSKDCGLTFQRLYEGPILDRTPIEPYFTASPYVLLDQGLWKIWYASSTGFILVNNKPEPLYQIKYAQSRDGITWDRNNIVCIDYKHANEANARPCVIKEEGIFKMWYCYRGSFNFRTNKEQSYRIGYAESNDGIKWVRKDDEIGIDCSGSGWDSVMMEYPYVYEHKGKKYMLYNGDGFGKSGFGYAVLERSGL